MDAGGTTTSPAPPEAFVLGSPEMIGVAGEILAGLEQRFDNWGFTHSS